MPPVQQKPDAGEGMVDTAADGVPAADSLRKVLRILLFVFSGVVEQTGQIGAFLQTQRTQCVCGQRRRVPAMLPDGLPLSGFADMGRIHGDHILSYIFFNAHMLML